MIEVKDLTKRFGETLAVDRLNFRVEKGEILGLLGPNGAGKTTTMRVLTGYFPPSGGTVSIAGRDVLDEPLAARRAVGYLPENVPLYGDMRVGEYLAFVGRVKGLTAEATRRELDRVMALLALGERRGQLIRQLSKGFRQRVGLAQALLADPPVLILDEPSIGLDPGQIVEVRSLIRAMAGEKTVIFSSHILPEVAATCSRVIIIHRGQLVAEGPPAMLNTAAGEGGQSLNLAATGPAEALAAALAAVPGVKAVAAEGPSPLAEDAWAFLVTTSGEAKVRPLLAQAVAAAGGGLLELASRPATLEEVFVRLTAEPAPSEEEAA
ncbi:MAG: ABC transporter ATP-binding protein [Deltaproteobacteria bacterium]|nr:ABC transporter ATP-binding protein [Deltaproteobacteria bacterium]